MPAVLLSLGLLTAEVWLWGWVLLHFHSALKPVPSLAIEDVRSPSPIAPQLEKKIEGLWAMRGHWLGSDLSSQPSQDRMGPSVNRNRLVNS